MTGIAGLYEGMDMAKVMMGQNAFHIAMNLIIQTYGNDTAAGVFQTKQGKPLYAGSERSHILMLGDMIYRPRVIVASDAFQGTGIGGLFTSGFTEMDKWIETGDLILVPDELKPR